MLKVINNKRFLGIYIKYIFFSLFVVESFFLVQVTFVLKTFKIQYAIVPTLLGIIIGVLLAKIVVLKTKLNEQNRVFRALVDFGQEFLCIQHIHGGYEYVSPYCETLTAYKPEEFYASPCKMTDIVHPEDKKRWLEHVNEVHSTGKAETLEIRIITKTGETKWINHICSGVFDQEGHLFAVRSTNIDITRHEEINLMKTRFLSKMSHEFRTPLNGIMGYAEIIEEELPDPELKRYVNMIIKSGERLMDTIDNILELSSLESNRYIFNFDILNLVTHTQAIVTNFQAKATFHGVTLLFRSSHDNMPIMSDTHALSRILTNLIDNALKFTKEGKVEVILTRQNIEKELWAELRIIDEGIGISEEFLPFVFEEFRQESEGNTRKFDGSGIGLAVVHRLVKTLNGIIWVESQKEQGSTFILQFPIEVNIISARSKFETQSF